MRSFFLSLRPRVIVLVCLISYLCASALSVIVAHVLAIIDPQSGIGDRIIAPTVKGLEFLDAHWKVVIMIVAPFVLPVARDLIPRLRKVGSLELDPVPLEPVGIHEKPGQKKNGGTK